MHRFLVFTACTAILYGCAASDAAQTNASDEGPAGKSAPISNGSNMSEKVDPTKYEGAVAAIEKGIGRHDGQFYRVSISNDSVDYTSVVSRNATSGRALAWDVTVLREVSQPLDVKLMVGLWQYNCRARNLIWLHALSVNDRYEVVDRSTPYFQEAGIDPNSAADEMRKFVCREQNSARSVRDILTDAESIFAATN